MFSRLCEWHIRVEGKVQGVGFRVLVQKMANNYSLSGYVRNCADGAVEICVQGSEENLRVFQESLLNRQGRCSIDRTQIQKARPNEKYSSFRILE
jgi:acylphosphatase